MNPKIVKILENMGYKVIVDEDVRIFDNNHEFPKAIINNARCRESFQHEILYKLNNNQYIKKHYNDSSTIKVNDRIIIVVNNWYNVYNANDLFIYYGNANDPDNYEYALCFSFNPACIFMGIPEILVKMFKRPGHEVNSLNKTMRIVDTYDGGIIYSGKEVIGMILDNERNPHDMCKLIIRYLDNIIERMDNEKLVNDIMYSIKLVYPSLLYMTDYYLEASDRISKEKGGK